jgi:hypothetical protein
MRVSLFSSADDAWPKPWETTWPDFVAEIKCNGHHFVQLPSPAEGLTKEVEKATKLAQAMFSPVEFRGRRSTQDAVLVHFGVLDLDHLTPDQLADFLLHVEEIRIEILLYTSWSHWEEHISARVLVPFTRPVAAHEWSTFWPRMNWALGGFGDPQCKNVDRAYFLPACPTWRAPQAEILHFLGRPLDVDSTLGVIVPASQLASSRSTVKVTREELAQFAKNLHRKNPETSLALQRVLSGEPWAEPGQRDNLLYRMAGDIAKAFPSADPSSIAFHFSQSVSHFSDFALTDVQEKIQRRQAEALEDVERQERAAVASARLAIRMAFRGTAQEGRETPYTPEEVEGFARESRCTVEEFQRRWIVQRGGSFYFWVAGRGYVGPYGEKDGKLAAHTFLAPATSVGLRLAELTIQGDFLQRTAEALAMEYGTIADALVMDLMAKSSTFEPSTGTLVEAPCPLRSLEPTYHADIHQWLRLLGGNEYGNLELWLAWVTALDRPAVALFLEGEPGAGKSLLAKGVARLWTLNQPTTLDQAMGHFNAALAECPLVFADEILPKDFRGRGRTGELREFIQADSRPYRRKYLPDATLRGAARVIIAANNRAMLEGEENLTPHDVAAIVGRFLHVEAPKAAAEFLRRTDTSSWVSGDAIARHVLWLVQNVERPANPPRFLVEAHAGRLHRSMTTSTHMGSAVAHWLVSFLMNPEKLRGGRSQGDSAHLVRVYGGILHVNPRALTDHWTAYPTNVPPDKATAKNVANGIRGMSPTTVDNRISLTVPGFPVRSRPKFYQVRTEDLVEWASSTGYASPEEILAALLAAEELDKVQAALGPVPGQARPS